MANALNYAGATEEQKYKIEKSVIKPDTKLSAGTEKKFKLQCECGVAVLDLQRLAEHERFAHQAQDRVARRFGCGFCNLFNSRRYFQMFEHMMGCAKSDWQLRRAEAEALAAPVVHHHREDAEGDYEDAGEGDDNEDPPGDGANIPAVE